MAGQQIINQKRFLGLGQVGDGNGGATGHQSEKGPRFGPGGDGTGRAIDSFWHGICDMISGKRGISCPLIPEKAF